MFESEYELTILGVKYTDVLFHRLLVASGIMLWFVSGLGEIQHRLVYVNR